MTTPTQVHIQVDTWNQEYLRRLDRVLAAGPRALYRRLSSLVQDQPPPERSVCATGAGLKGYGATPAAALAELERVLHQELGPDIALIIDH